MIPGVPGISGGAGGIQGGSSAESTAGPISAGGFNFAPSKGPNTGMVIAVSVALVGFALITSRRR